MVNKLAIFTFRLFRKIYKSLHRIEKSVKNELKFDYVGQTANSFIEKQLENKKPLMIVRLGNVEMHTVVPYFLNQNYSLLERIIKYSKREIGQFWWDKESRNTISVNAGFFPNTDIMLTKFSELVLADLKEIDILGSWTPYENDLKDVLKGCIKVPMRDLEPYYHTNPWSEVLKGKKILVVYPFSESIEKQYKKRTDLFQDERVLPEFELITLKSVQSIAGNKPEEFETWFEALESMKSQISNIDFDIAIIGAGAYGLSLAAHVKRIGKQAIQLGGATQILFGIKGSRWEEIPEISCFFNEHWINPLPEDRPKGFEKIENGCYW